MFGILNQRFIFVHFLKMEPYFRYLNELMNRNQSAFGKYRHDLKWMNYSASYEKQLERDNLLNKNKDNFQWLFHKTKPWINRLSEGCRLCGRGDWSCLFITGKCNANCFYCPAPQNEEGLPTTQMLRFDTPEKYSEYINFFGFKGVSFSGGEPLLSFDKTIAYLCEIRKNCHPGIYIWLYTNGILGSDEYFRALADAGINEIRFDIGATAYRLDAIKIAKKYVENITVEIPAIPEHLAKLKTLLPEMVDAGVTNLNLHQLRLTQHNSPKLLPRNYSLIHGEQPTVVESELSALSVMDFALNNRIDIGINYCCFQYKRRFQQTGFRNKIALPFRNNDESVTQNGFLRKIYPVHTGEMSTLTLQNDESSTISYRAIHIFDNLMKHISETSIEIGGKKYYVVSKDRGDFTICKDNFEEFMRLVKQQGKYIPNDMILFKIWQLEYIEYGWRDYF